MKTCIIASIISATIAAVPSWMHWAILYLTKLCILREREREQEREREREKRREEKIREEKRREERKKKTTRKL